MIQKFVQRMKSITVQESLDGVRMPIAGEIVSFRRG